MKDLVDIELTIREKTDQEIDEVVGAFDDFDTVESDVLVNVSPEDEPIIEALGAIKYPDGRWHVSESDSANFKPWHPKVPSDLIVRFKNSKVTKSGKAMDAAALPVDTIKGTVSSAMPLMFAALPVVACATFILSRLFGSYGYLALLAAIPYLKAIKLDKSAAHAVGSFFFLLMGPLFMGSQMTGGILASYARVAFSGPGLIGLAVGLTVLIVVTFLFCFLGGKVGTKMERTLDTFKNALKIEFVFIAYAACVSVLPLPLNLLFIFTLPTLYAIRYTEVERETRANELADNSIKYSMGRHERLARKMRKQQWMAQALRAVKDKTPLIILGKATGFLFNKMYPFAPIPNVGLVASIKDFSQHTLVIGKSGGGKTFWLRKIMALIKLTNTVGAIVGDGKNVLVREVLKLMDIVIKPGINLSLSQGMNAQQLVQAFRELKRKGKMSEDESSFWTSMGFIVLEHVAMIVEAVSEAEKYIQLNLALKLSDEEDQLVNFTAISRLAELEGNKECLDLAKNAIAETQANIDKLELALKIPRGCFWTIGAIQKFLNVINQVRQTKDGYELHEDFRGAFDFIDQSGYLEVADAANQIKGSISYFVNTWSAMAHETRTSITSNIDNALNDVFRGRYLKNEDGILWADIETGIDFQSVLTEKKWLGVDLPTMVHGVGGQITADIVRMRVYNMIKNRPENWADLEGHNGVFNFIDEAQSVIGEAERDLIAMARSLGCYFVFLTQNISSFLANFSEHGAHNLFELFATKVLMQNESSHSTYKYFQEMLGKARLTPYKTRSVGINNEAMLARYAHSALVDPDHPDAVMMQVLREKGVGVVQNSGVHRAPMQIDAKDAAHRFEDIERIGNINLEEVSGSSLEWVMDDDDFSKTLFQGQALIIVSRAGSTRTEICQVDGLEADQVDEFMNENRAA
ncbi:type IV secretion system DNA-binding domain-containing protein [Xanthomonas cannabis]|uniref:type IV secretion system DNA-binding domain-containing protein n=1 Tax=Xanthomonas cannabis TaxID=1885674 RepID=UPI00194DDA95|nr:type IV secretion system DNA-binding domain-containing protein [Xanthomonas cannabis]